LEASRLLTREGKLTPVDGANTVEIVQEVTLPQATNVIALRAVGRDDNDEQRYITVRRRDGPTSKAGRPGVGLGELRTALQSHVATPHLVEYIGQFGIDSECS